MYHSFVAQVNYSNTNVISLFSSTYSEDSLAIISIERFYFSRLRHRPTRRSITGTMSKLVYRSTSGKIPAYSLPAHIRRPVLKGLSALGSSLCKIEEAERSLNVLTADSWRALDVLVGSSDVLNWPLQLLRALGVLEAVMCGDVASMWNRRSS